MSYDLNLPTLCNHRIFRELTLLNKDHRSLRVSKPIASAANMRVYAADNLVPKTMYTVIYDPLSVAKDQTRMISFKDKWRSPSDIFEVTYVTRPNFCPKCRGQKSIDDISYDIKGHLKIARDERLLLQNLEKFTVTEINSNPFHAFIGTALVSLLGDKISDPDFLTTKLIQEINASLKKLADLQGQYVRSGREMTDGERLDSIEDVRVNFDENDPTILRADITVSSKSGKALSFAQYLKTPEV